MGIAPPPPGIDPEVIDDVGLVIEPAPPGIDGGFIEPAPLCIEDAELPTDGTPPGICPTIPAIDPGLTIEPAILGIEVAAPIIEAAIPLPIEAAASGTAPAIEAAAFGIADAVCIIDAIGFGNAEAPPTIDAGFIIDPAVTGNADPGFAIGDAPPAIEFIIDPAEGGLPMVEACFVLDEFVRLTIFCI